MVASGTVVERLSVGKNSLMMLVLFLISVSPLGRRLGFSLIASLPGDTTEATSAPTLSWFQQLLVGSERQRPSAMDVESPSKRKKWLFSRSTNTLVNKSCASATGSPEVWVALSTAPLTCRVRLCWASWRLLRLTVVQVETCEWRRGRKATHTLIA